VAQSKNCPFESSKNVINATYNNVI